jgi:hypothetical protein
MDNPGFYRLKATSDYLKGFNIRLVPHPPFSLGLATSEFYLFVVIKGKMDGSELGSAEDLASEVTDIANLISHIILADVVLEWEQRLNNSIETEADYLG